MFEGKSIDEIIDLLELTRFSREITKKAVKIVQSNVMNGMIWSYQDEEGIVHFWPDGTYMAAINDSPKIMNEVIRISKNYKKVVENVAEALRIGWEIR